MPFSALAGCTVVTADYLPWVRVTAASFAEHHPGADFAVLVIDEPAPSQLRADDPFTVLRPADVRLSADELAWLDLIYSPVELCCALKPWLIRRVLDDAEVVLYIDADMCVYAPLTEVAEQARQAAVVLSAHSLAPRTDPRMPDDDALLQFGQFNGGFLAVSRAGRSFADWWADRCARECTDWNPAVPRRYLDQRWLDLAIGYFDTRVTRDPGINLARWNMYQRDFDLVDGRFVVDGGPLRCFHFSAFNPADPTSIRREGYTHPKVDPQQSPPLRELLEDYARRLIGAGWRPAEGAREPRHIAGIELTPALRATIRAGLIDAERIGAVPSDAARHPEKLVAWLQSPVRADMDINWYQWGLHAAGAAGAGVAQNLPAAASATAPQAAAAPQAATAPQAAATPQAPTTARRVHDQSVMAARAAVGLENAREHVTLCFGADLFADAGLLASYARHFSAADDATLAIYLPASDVAAAAARLLEVVTGLGLDGPDGPDMIGLPFSGTADEPTLAHAVDAVLALTPPSGAFASLPWAHHGTLEQIHAHGVRREEAAVTAEVTG